MGCALYIEHVFILLSPVETNTAFYFCQQNIVTSFCVVFIYVKTVCYALFVVLLWCFLCALRYKITLLFCVFLEIFLRMLYDGMLLVPDEAEVDL